MDRFDLYEHCVQDVATLVPILRAIHGGAPAVLGEDFCGTAAVSRAWLDGGSDRRAVAVDHDVEVVSRIVAHDGLEVHGADVTSVAVAADVIYVGNFSIGEWHTRADLVAYFAHVHSRLRPHGVFVCDTYGGESAFMTGSVDRRHRLDDGRVVLYEWEQRRADPLTGRVENAIHFTLRNGARTETRIRDAFVYDWRLWSVPELRDAMVDAGFGQTDVYGKVPDAMDGDGQAYVTPRAGEEMDESYDVLVAARSTPGSGDPVT